MLGTLTELLASSGLGAFVGLLGSWLTKREERRSLELRLKHEASMATIRREEVTAEFAHELAMANKEIARTETEGVIARDVEELAAFREGLKEQQMLYKVKWVDAIRGLMRPLITAYLLILATGVTLRIGALTRGLESLDESVLTTLYGDTITQIFFLVTTAVTWWFGSRPGGSRRP